MKRVNLHNSMKLDSCPLAYLYLARATGSLEGREARESVEKVSRSITEVHLQARQAKQVAGRLRQALDPKLVCTSGDRGVGQTPSMLQIYLCCYYVSSDSLKQALLYLQFFKPFLTCQTHQCQWRKSLLKKAFPLSPRTGLGLDAFCYVRNNVMMQQVISSEL